MKKVELWSTTAGSGDYPVKEAYMNGYWFGDRLLEDVIFKVAVNAAGDDIIIECSDGLDYFNDLNTTKWLKEAKKHLMEFPDDLSITPDCSQTCEVELINHPGIKNRPTPIPVQIKSSSIKDVLDSITTSKSGIGPFKSIK